jgi:hypothetical protein
MKVYSLTVRNRVGALLVAIVVLGAGAALVILGVALLAALAAAGVVMGSGYALYARLRGGERMSLGGASPASSARATLDPALEVFPAHPAVLGPSVTSDEHL